MSYNNLHVYFGGYSPGTSGWGDPDPRGNNYGGLPYQIDQGNLDAPGVTDQITETGYLNLTSPTTNEIPEATGASYFPRTLLLAFNNGIKRTFIYELLDEVSSPNYGLIRQDMTEKPSFLAVKNLNAILSDPGVFFSPGQLSYTLTGGDSTLKRTLLQKRDGSFWLIVWLEEASYDTNANQPIAIAPQNVTLTLAGANTLSSLSVFDATGNVTTTAESGTGLTFPVSDQVAIVKIH